MIMASNVIRSITESKLMRDTSQEGVSWFMVTGRCEWGHKLGRIIRKLLGVGGGTKKKHARENVQEKTWFACA